MKLLIVPSPLAAVATKAPVTRWNRQGLDYLSPSVSSGVVRVRVRRDHRTVKRVMMSLSFPVRWRWSSQQYDDTTARSVRRRVDLTVRWGVSSFW